MGKRTISDFFSSVPKRSNVGKPVSAAVVEENNQIVIEDDAQPGVLTSPSQEPLHSKVPLNKLLRSTSNKNTALAKLAVKQAVTLGQVPSLRNLLTEASWLEQLSHELESPYIKSLEKFVQQEWAGRQPIFPPKELIFRAFNTVPFHHVRVVILGQDPYHGPNQAVGLCFSVPRDEKRPSSLLNIYKELHADCGCRIATHGCLESWATQGVFMLNTVLTVRAHQANSHARKGWEAFTDAAIQRISSGREGVVFLLWGKQAQDKARLIDPKKHHILKSAHPSGLSANRGFFGCRHFSQTNELLRLQGLDPIDWQV